MEGKPWPGRKFLVAGRGGLNLTHSEPLETFQKRFLGGEDRWPGLLKDFGPEALRSWSANLGVPTYVGSSGRVFPEGDQAARLLRLWLARLKEAGTEIQTEHRFLGFSGPSSYRIQGPQAVKEVASQATILALGGGSWPETGSDGSWVKEFQSEGLQVTPLKASNCGYEVAWPPDLLTKIEGLPLKNLAVSCGKKQVRGELLVTRYGLEGGSLYQLGATLRQRLPVKILLDLKPEVTREQLMKRLKKLRGKGSWLRRAGVAWKLCPVGKALLALGLSETPEQLATRVKALPLKLLRPRPLAEAISSAGGVSWNELNEDLMLVKRPGTFLAGEMLDWDAPTGGYLLTGCMATGTRAGRGALRWLQGMDLTPPQPPHSPDKPR
jgi:uncharacterized flavoprotein (TIGR03862 family)